MARKTKSKTVGRAIQQQQRGQSFQLIYVEKSEISSTPGIEKCNTRAKEHVYWPGITAEIKDIISNCSTSLTDKESPTVILYLKRMNAKLGIPHTVISDNGPEFKTFTKG